MPLPLPFTDYDLIIAEMFENTELFFEITVQDLLFNGVEICKPANKISLGSKLFCLFVRLMNLKNIRYEADSTMFFSFLEYVSVV